MPVQKVTKEDILLNAADVFRERGYHNTSMQNIGEACGLLKGSLYHYFASKEILMQELLLWIHAHLKERIFPIALDTTLTPEQRLEKLLKKMGKLLLEKPGGCLLGNTILETVGVVMTFEAVLKRIIDDWTEALQAIFMTSKTAEQSLRLAQLTIIEFEGAVMMSKLYGHKQFLYDAFARTMMRLQ
jgi:AcrR family transcriptional regulator